MDTKQGLRIEAYQLLAEGKGANEIAKELGLNYRLVCKLQKDLSMYTLDEVLASIDSDKELVELLEIVKANTPAKLHKKLDTMGKGLTGLQAIQSSMQNEMSKAMTIGREMMEREDLKPSDWATLAKGMATLYDSMYSVNKGTQINVQQTQNNLNDAVTERLNGLTKGIFDSPAIEGEVE